MRILKPRGEVTDNETERLWVGGLGSRARDKKGYYIILTTFVHVQNSA